MHFLRDGIVQILRFKPEGLAVKQSWCPEFARQECNMVHPNISIFWVRLGLHPRTRSQVSRNEKCPKIVLVPFRSLLDAGDNASYWRSEDGEAFRDIVLDIQHLFKGFALFLCELAEFS